MATAIETKPFSHASRRARPGSNRGSSKKGLGGAARGFRVARLADHAGERLELLLIEAREQLSDLLERAQHALLQRCTALGGARYEHRAPVAAVRDTADQ